jgi:hypothetical protein
VPFYKPLRIPMSREQLTILRTVGSHRAQKSFIAGENPRAYDSGWQFATETSEVDSLPQFAQLLANIEQDPSAFLIRGKLKAQTQGGQLVRRKYLGEDAAFEPCSRRLLCVDVDNVVAPDGLDPCSRAAIDHVVSLLPTEFHDADVVAQFSNSAGTVGAGRKIKIHLWYWGEREYSDIELKRWARTNKIVDGSLFSAVQPHYTARPKFVGLPDPFEGKSRTCLIERAKKAVAIKLPQLDSYAAAPLRTLERENAEFLRDDGG